jgi:hypothetical protein
MDGSEVLKALATGCVTFLVGFVLHQFQLGGGRRRARRELIDELELLAKLPDDDPHKRRIEDRVARLLDEYVPEPPAVASEDRTNALRAQNKRNDAQAYLLGLLAAIAAVVTRAIFDTPWWLSAVAGAAFSLLINAVLDFLRERRALAKASSTID